MADADMVDVRVDGLYRLVKGRINWDNLVPTVLEVARELQQFPGLKGSEKLDILLKTLKFALKDSSLTAEEKEKTLYVIDTVVPLVVAAAKMASKFPIQRISWKKCCW
jgi:hypothetical protein